MALIHDDIKFCVALEKPHKYTLKLKNGSTCPFLQ